jgi:hypothetical protein
MAALYKTININNIEIFVHVGTHIAYIHSICVSRTAKTRAERKTK